MEERNITGLSSPGNNGFSFFVHIDRSILFLVFYKKLKPFSSRLTNRFAAVEYTTFNFGYYFFDRNH